MSLPADPETLDLEASGAQLFRGILSDCEVEALRSALQPHDFERAGSRLHNMEGLRLWLGTGGAIRHIVVSRLGPAAAPVRAILFDKSAGSNWALSWHQDRTIAVAKRAEVARFVNWNRKGGVDHVEPPFHLIERMITVRIHLDPVSSENAPLLISPGTHRLGRITENDIAEVVERHGCVECLAQPGDVWLYRTPIVHASRRATKPARRRVLQVDYSADALPHPLRWRLTP